MNKVRTVMKFLKSKMSSMLCQHVLGKLREVWNLAFWSWHSISEYTKFDYILAKLYIGSSIKIHFSTLIKIEDVQQRSNTAFSFTFVFHNEVRFLLKFAAFEASTSNLPPRGTDFALVWSLGSERSWRLVIALFNNARTAQDPSLVQGTLFARKYYLMLHRLGFCVSKAHLSGV